MAARDLRIAYFLLAGFTLLTLVFAGTTPLTADELSYWQWSRHLDFGYFDHPPMVAYLIALGTWLFGPSPFGIRVFGVLAAAGAMWASLQLALRIGGGRAAFWTLLAWLGAPMLSMGAMIVTPDSPLLLFWGLSLLFLLRALESGRPADWVVLGLVTGGGLLSKYPIALLPMAMLLALLLHKRGRQALVRPGPWLAMAIMFAVAAPYLWWLTHTPLSPLTFQLQHGLGAAAGQSVQPGGWVTFGRFWGGQLATVTPILFGFFLWALLAALRDYLAMLGQGDGEVLEQALLLYPILIVLLVFAAASWFKDSGPNWVAPMYLSGFALTGALLARLAHDGRRVLVGLFVAGLLLGGGVTLYFHVEAAHPMVAWRKSPFNRITPHAALGRWAGELIDTAPAGRRAALFSDGYRTASILAYTLPGRPDVYDPFETGSGTGFLLWQPALQAGRPAWYFTQKADDPRAGWLLKNARLAGRFQERRLGVPGDTVYAWQGDLRRSLPAPADGLRRYEELVKPEQP
ncbi:MAG: glycosyltransferase family 39 protein [Gammaproteobacteria bacterium]